MMVPERKYGHETYEIPQRYQRRKPAPIYRERMMQRRQEVEQSAQESQRISAARAAKTRRGWALCLTLAAGLVVLCGMRIYQSAASMRNAATITSLKDEIHELTMDAENYECRIAEAAADDKIEAGAKQLGMTYPTDDQVREITN